MTTQIGSWIFMDQVPGTKFEMIQFEVLLGTARERGTGEQSRCVSLRKLLKPSTALRLHMCIGVIDP